MTKDTVADVASLAAQFRQALQGCSSHPGGPLAAYDRCRDALQDGSLSPQQFQQIGHELIAISRRRIERCVDATSDGPARVADQALVRRERRMMRYVAALFTVDNPEDEPPQAVPVSPVAVLEPTAVAAPSFASLPQTLIAVVGKGRNCPERVYRLGGDIGAQVGSRRDRCALLTGGLGGVMEAAAVEVRRHGGLVLSVLPGGEHRTTAAHGAAHIAIDTGLTAHVRNIVLASAASALVAAPGSHGTSLVRSSLNAQS